MSTVSDGLYQYGGVPVGGLFMPGKVFFVRPGTGSDSNSGKTPAKALKTVSQAHTLMTANSNDVAYLIAESNTASATTDYYTATLTWSKDLTHLVGMGVPTMVSQRSRIAQTSTATGVSPLVDVTADGCIFKNFQVFHGVADATSLIAVRVTGDRNYFERIHFAGIGDATMSAAGATSLAIVGGDENVFKDSVIGLDTITQDADGVNLIMDTGASRNMFDDCLFQSYISATGASHVSIADSTAIDRWLWFRRCLFMSKSTNKTVDMAEVFQIPAGISQGAIVLQDCTTMNDGGAPVWTAGTEGIVWANMPAAATSAAGGFMTNL